MARQFSLPYQLAPDTLLGAAADAAGRTGQYVSLRNALKAWIVCKVNQGNAATVLFSPLQATSSAGASSKAISNAVPIWANQDCAGGDGNTAQAAATTFTTSATTKDKRVIFEIEPETALDVANGFSEITVSTGASNASNVTSAEIFVLGSYQGASAPTDRV